MEELDLTGVERVLAVMAHPDDVDFGWAGSVAVMTDAGIEVVYCLVTDGDAGGSETGIPREEMAPLRRDEQRAAAAIVGVHELHFLGLPRRPRRGRRSSCAATSPASSARCARTGS